MTTKTIPAYLEDERQKGRDTQLRTEEEAANAAAGKDDVEREAKKSRALTRIAKDYAPVIAANAEIERDHDFLGSC